jgi:hypothetical protein
VVGLRRQIEPSTSRACFNELAEPPVVGDELCGVRGGADGRLLLDAFTEITTDYEQAVPVCRAAVNRLRTDMTSAEAELRWFYTTS